MKKSKSISFALLAVLTIISLANIATAATWGVCNGDELMYEATYHIDNQFITQTTTMNVSFDVTYVNDYVNADMNEDGGSAVEVFFNTQSLDDDFGINIRASNGINIRYIADEQRFQAQMTQIDNEIGAVLANFSMSRAGNNLTISAYGGGAGTSWTYDAEIHYTNDYVLNSMSEDLFQTDGIDDAVQNVVWTKVYHHSDCTTSSTTQPTTSTTTPAATPPPGLPTSMIYGVSAAVGVGVIVVVAIVIKRR
ncbi:MAG: hypothetical protein ACXADF_08425 [Candidatus Thorarchaeota archaeon]|jgi:hypothetical protein